MQVLIAIPACTHIRERAGPRPTNRRTAYFTLILLWLCAQLAGTYLRTTTGYCPTLPIHWSTLLSFACVYVSSSLRQVTQLGSVRSSCPLTCPNHRSVHYSPLSLHFFKAYLTAPDIIISYQRLSKFFQNKSSEVTLKSFKWGEVKA